VRTYLTPAQTGKIPAGTTTDSRSVESRRNMSSLGNFSKKKTEDLYGGKVPRNNQASVQKKDEKPLASNRGAVS